MVSFDETGHSSVVIQHSCIFVTDKHTSFVKNGKLHNKHNSQSSNKTRLNRKPDRT